MSLLTISNDLFNFSSTVEKAATAATAGAPAAGAGAAQPAAAKAPEAKAEKTAKK